MKKFVPIVVVAALGFGYASAVFVPSRLMKLLDTMARPRVSLTDQLLPPGDINWP
jgi:hypothetical protein